VKLEDRIVRSIKQRKGVVILRSEVAPLGSTAQVGRVLAKLVADGKLVRVSKGVFAKTRINKFTGKLAPAATFERIAAETFRKLNVCVQPGQLAREYNAGGTTQIPMDGVVSTGARRITRKIQVGGRTVKYEKNNGRAVSAMPDEVFDGPLDRSRIKLPATDPEKQAEQRLQETLAGLRLTPEKKDTDGSKE